MTVGSMLKPGLSIALVAAVLLLALTACGSDPTPTRAPETVPASDPSSAKTPGPTATAEATPTATPAPTPTLTAGEQLNQLLSSVEEKLAAVTTVTFDMVDESESGAPFFGTTFKSLTGQVKSPDRFWMQVKVVAPGFGFVEIELMAVGQDSYIKFSEDAPWTPLPLDQVPFNFGEFGLQLSRMVPVLSDVSQFGPESVDGVRTIGFEGTISSEGMSDLITGVDPGHSVTLTFWVDELDHSLRQFRMAGKLFNDDGPETVRLVNITGVNVDVDIQLPDSANRQ